MDYLLKHLYFIAKNEPIYIAFALIIVKKNYIYLND